MINDVSIIMPTYNKAEYLNLTLAAFSIQTYHNFDMIILDDGSTDHTEQVVNDYKKKLNINYIYQENQGRGTARNKALEIAKGEFIIFNDDDRIPTLNFVESHLQTLKEKPQCVSIGSKHLILSIFNDEIDIELALFKRLARENPKLLLNENNAELFTKDELINNFDQTISKWYLKEPRDNNKDVTDRYSDELNNYFFGWTMATTGNMAYKKNNSYNVKFDENYKGWGAEDTDFSYQLALSGYYFYFSRNAINYHQVHKRGQGEWDQLLNNIDYFANKFKSPETYLFKKVFRDEFSFIEANEIYLSLRNLSSDDELKKDYLRLISAKK